MTKLMPWVTVLPLLVSGPDRTASRREVTLAAPRIILFYGPPLTHRIYLTDWHENLRFMVAVSEPVEGEDALRRERPHIDVALFWTQDQWARFAHDSLQRLRPENAQGARLLLARGDLPALFDYYSAESQPGLRRIAPEGLAILGAHGIPWTTSESLRANPSTAGTPAETAQHTPRTRCPDQVPLPSPPGADLATRAAVREAIPTRYTAIRWSGYAITDSYLASTRPDDAYSRMAATMCGQTVRDRTWIVKVHFPAMEPEASTSQGQLFVSLFPTGWKIWFQYH